MLYLLEMGRWRTRRVDSRYADRGQAPIRLGSCNFRPVAQHTLLLAVRVVDSTCIETSFRPFDRPSVAVVVNFSTFLARWLLGLRALLGTETPPFKRTTGLTLELLLVV